MYMMELSNRKSATMSDAEIRASLTPFGVSITGAQFDSVRCYISLLLHWNQHVSLTALTDPGEILRRHFGESMFAGRFLEFPDGRLADVGSGAGFPGLALKIASPDLRILLIESNSKKAAFLSEVKRALGLSQVEVVRSRFEDVRVPPPLADYVAARALGNLRKLVNWSGRALTPNGRILLWLGSDDAVRVSRVKNWAWQPPIPLPESRRRVLLFGRPLQA